jgi:purine-binding chemotaxis protein CheW
MKHPAMGNEPTTAHARGLAMAAREVLTFRLGTESFGVAILLVHEIRCFETPTPLPGAPRNVSGVVNLRGSIVPVIDLRGAIGMPARAPDPLTVLIVLGLPEMVVGVVVDAVDDVVALSAEQVKAPPRLRDTGAANHVEAIATLDERLVTLLDFEQLVRAEAVGTATHALQ